jgi:VCBS repeat-containing protein
LPSPELSQIAASIIQQVFSQRFPGYTPPSTSQSGGGAGSTPANPPGNDVPQFHDGGGDPPAIIPINIQIPNKDGTTKTVTIPVNVGVVDVAPTVTGATLSVLEGGTTLLKTSDIRVVDPDNNSFTFTATATHGTFQLNTGGNIWIATTTFTTADLATGHVRFVSDGSDIPPTVSLVASDGHLNSAPFNVTVDFNPSSLSSTAGVSINLSLDGATEGFTFPGAGNVTTPGAPEDRIVLGYETPDLSTHVLNSAPMLGVQDFHATGSTISDGGTTVATGLDAGNNVALTQTISLGTNASYFTTTINVSNSGSSDITGVRFLRNFDPDQDVQKYGDYTTFNDVVQNPTADEPFAIISAKGVESGVTISMIGIGLAWRASVYGFTNTDPYADAAYSNPVDPNGTRADLALTLTYDFGTIGHSEGDSSAQATFITTDNVATTGDDALFGTTGNDTINGLGGNDILIGLGGADTFVFTSGTTGHATVYDFAPGTDKIQLADFDSTFNPNNDGSFDSWLTAHASDVAHSSDSGTDVLINLDLNHPGQDTVLLQNTAMSDLHASDFVVDFVNHAPVVTGDVTGTPKEDGSVSSLDALANATDSDHDTLSVVNIPTSLPNGVTYNGADHTFTLDPGNSASQSLADGAQTVVTVNYGVSDGTATTGASVSWTVTGIDDAPVISTDGLSLSGGGSASSPVTILGLSVSDPDSGDTFTLSTTHNSSGSSTSPATSSGDLTAINTALTSGITYDPGSTPPQTDSVSVTVTDAHNATDTVNFIFNVAGTGPVTLQGTSDKDVLFATSNQDTFVFSPNSNHDTIVGFTEGQDQIDLQQFTNITSANISSLYSLDGSGNTIIHLDPSDPTDHNTILVKAVTNLSTSDFVLHSGS